METIGGAVQEEIVVYLREFALGELLQHGIDLNKIMTFGGDEGHEIPRNHGPWGKQFLRKSISGQGMQD